MTPGVDPDPGHSALPLMVTAAWDINASPVCGRATDAEMALAAAQDFVMPLTWMAVHITESCVHRDSLRGSPCELGVRVTVAS